jgi:hypothetical protein
MGVIAKRRQKPRAAARPRSHEDSNQRWLAQACCLLNLVETADMWSDAVLRFLAGCGAISPVGFQPHRGGDVACIRDGLGSLGFVNATA